MRIFFGMLLIMAFYPASISAQWITPRVVCQLPDTVNESSGLQAVSPNRIYTHNDSGDLPRIYLIDTLGNLLRTIYLSQAGAIDYEEITGDPSGNLYIGDMGNNLHLRTDLRIYKIPNPELLSGDTAIAEIISFSYPDQQLFPPPADDQNFDCEAFYFYNDSLYLFSKNWGVSDFCRIYSLPATPGNYTATLIDSLYTGEWITAASLNPSGTALALLSESRIWLYNGIEGNNFSASQVVPILIDSTQKEGITFLNDTAVYISDEKFNGVGGNLYYLSLGNWMPRITPPASFAVVLLDNPSHEGFTISCLGTASYTLEIYDVTGKLLDALQVNNSSGTYHYFKPLAGLLLARITSKEETVLVKKVLIY